MALATLAGTAGQAETYKGYEMPPFSVVAESPAYELRDYDPHLLATVRVTGSLQGAASTGFRALAGYIFGGNAAGEKIAMTVPVAQVPRENGYEISFMMPARYGIDDLPKPENANIRFSRTGAERLAARQFSGWANKATLRRVSAELQDALARDGLTVTGPARYAYYDDPFTLPWKRRNEVLIPVAR